MNISSTWWKTAACAAILCAFPALSKAQEIVIEETQNWDFLHPMGTLPPRADSTADPNFTTTWFLPQAQFLTDYDGPSFTAGTIGDPLIPSSADSGPAPGPFSYGGVDAIFPLTELTLPASGKRFASYYRTTFTVPAGGLIDPTFRMVCDDGAYLYLDGTLIATVNITDGVADTYTSLATDPTNAEVIFEFPTRTTGLKPGGSPDDVKVIVAVPALAAGNHTLAVSVHNNAATSSDMGMQLELSALLPSTTTIHAVVGSAVRDLKGTPTNLDDDEFSFQVILDGNKTGATWTSDGPVASGAYGVPVTMGPFSASGPAFVNFTASADPSAQTEVIVDPPTALTTIVNYNQTWKLMNPLAGVLPPRPGGGADVDFETTWFLNESNFVTQYNGPTFGSGGVTGSYEALTGPGPFAVGGVDGIAAGRPVGAVGTVPTLPASGNRRGMYFRTTFTTTQPIGLVTLDLLCDDGAYIYLDGNLVAQENMLDPENYSALAVGARDENLITTIDLSQPPGGNVVATVAGLAPGVHTLAVSLHQNALTSSDLGVALKVSGVVSVGQPVIEAVVSDILRNESGTPGVLEDDTFSFKVTVNGSNAGTSWTSNSTPATGNYGVATTFGPYPVINGNRTVNFSATSSPATATSVTVLPPTSTISAAVSGIARNDNSTPTDPSDDTLTFNVLVTGTFLTPEWLSSVALPASGSYGVPTLFGPFPANVPQTVTITDSGDSSKAVSFTIQPPRYIPLAEMVPYSQTWKVMNPQLAVVPDGPGGFDDNFDTTWYLKESDFLTQYNGPNFGSGGVAGNYEAIQGPGPFAVGGIDGLAAGTTIGPVGTTVTLPATDNRYTSYYRTTFTTAQVIDNIMFNLLCDDGVFIYLDGVLVAKENMPAGDSFNALASGPRSEFIVNTIDLSANPGGNVVTRMPSLPAGTHTLAVSLHQNAATSTDLGLALTFFGRVSTGVSVTAALGTVTRDLNNTVTTADDTFSFPVTVNAISGGAAGWISNGLPANGSYGVATTYGPLPVSDSPKSLTFKDSVDDLARATVIATPPPIFGLTSFNGTVAPITPVLPVPATWTSNSGAISHSTSVGVAAPGSTLSMQPVDLSGVSGPVLFQMDLTLADTSATTNFELTDTVLVELVLNNGAGEQRVNLITPWDFNGDGALNGFNAADAAAYNLDKFQDELNGGGVNAEASVNHTFALSSVIPDGILSAQAVVTVVALGGSESVTVSNVTFIPYIQPDLTDTDHDGQTDASEAIAGTDPNNASDVLNITGITRRGAEYDIVFPSKNNRNYRLEVSTRLTGGWVPLGDLMSGTGGNISATVPELIVPGATGFFYRLRVVP